MALSACGGGDISNPLGGPGGNHGQDTHTGGGGGVNDPGSSSGGGGGGNVGGGGIGGGEIPGFACGSEAPAAFVSTCGGCHDLSGQGNSAFPDLFAFAGSEAEFLDIVRNGSGAMPAFSREAISDDTLRAAYAFLNDADADRPSVSLGSVVPLFPEPLDVVPITFMRADGVLVTRGAGRVRQRHELEGTYGPFGPHYFEDRTYGFIVEDFTVKGESRIRVTYLPVAMPTDGTNFRSFKIYGDGNVFYINAGMTSDVPLPSLAHGGKNYASDYEREVAAFARVQVQEVTRNPREEREIRPGDVFEFEFGIFIDPNDVRANSRTSYYTDTFRYQVGVGGLTPENRDTSGTLGPVRAAQLGGATTVTWAYAEPETYYSQMALNIQHEHVQDFVEGRRLFHTDFGTGRHSEGGNPDFPEQAGKLGPLFATTACVNCHKNNGGGHTLEGAFNEDTSMAFKLYNAGDLGNQLQLQEGTVTRGESIVREVELADGTRVTLTRPTFEVRANQGDASRYSARVARRIVGMGLLEAMDELTLLGRADPEDCNGDGISGRPNFIKDPETQVMRLGRFGWKAEKVSVEHQVADALEADLGVTSRIIKGQNGEAELSDADLQKLTAYMRLLGVPPQRDREDPVVSRGELVFRSVGCANCHVPEAVTGENHPFVELRSQVIRPFTDLLLHDMGPDLADASGEAGDRTGDQPASASEWRTPPLWGVGLSRDVQGRVSLLHDGRAQSVLEAVLWHGGEAADVRDRVVALPTDEREALLRFVESL